MRFLKLWSVGSCRRWRYAFGLSRELPTCLLNVFLELLGLVGLLFAIPLVPLVALFYLCRHSEAERGSVALESYTWTGKKRRAE